MATLSAIFKAALISWVIIRTAHPLSAKSLKSFNASFKDFSSSPGVGSSAIITSALETKALDKSTFLAIPPDNWKG